MRSIRAGIACIFVFALGSAGVPWVRAEESVAPTPSASSSPGAVEDVEVERKFLSLPLISMEDEPGQPKHEELQVGDELRFVVTGLPSATAAKPAPKAKPFLDQGVSVRIVKSGDPLVIGIAPLKGGAFALEPLVFVDANGVELGRSDPMHLSEVKSSIDPSDQKAQEAAPPRAPVAVGYPAWLIAVLTVAALAIFAAMIRGLLILRERMKNRRGPAEVAAPLVPKTADAVALEELALLESKRFPDAGKFKPHYFGISETLKKYIGARFGFDAQESTSHEVIVELERRAVAVDGLLDRLEKAFDLLDRVKFTDHHPDSAEPGLLLEEARDFIRKTRPVLVAAPILPQNVAPSVAAGPGRGA